MCKCECERERERGTMQTVRLLVHDHVCVGRYHGVSVMPVPPAAAGLMKLV